MRTTPFMHRKGGRKLLPKGSVRSSAATLSSVSRSGFTHLEIQPQRRDGGDFDRLVVKRMNPLLERVDLRLVDRQTGGHLVPAEVLQEIAAALQGGVHLKGAEAAAGAAAEAVVVDADHDGREQILLGDAGGDDPHHALVPAPAREHDGPLGRRVFNEGRHSLVEDTRFQLAPLVVQAAQLHRQLLRLPPRTP